MSESALRRRGVFVWGSFEVAREVMLWGVNCGRCVQRGVAWTHQVLPCSWDCEVVLYVHSVCPTRALLFQLWGGRGVVGFDARSILERVDVHFGDVDITAFNACGGVCDVGLTSWG